ncbi:MAG: hypothetical protein EAZ57_08220 [Cytophagales bacterium]|nr:MAG: hypothetical protein EAZ67_09295 [Cytophagales bacterium]TAF60318.1 MAG: hypothetical protein EAZ57_08220 [Cytophagales bacterium]
MPIHNLLLDYEALQQYSLQGLNRKPFTEDYLNALYAQFGTLPHTELLLKWQALWFLLAQNAQKIPLHQSETFSAPAEQWPYCSALWQNTLQKCIESDQNTELCAEFLARLVAQKQLLPPVFLPQLLALLEDASPRYQRLLVLAGGERLRWAFERNNQYKKIFDWQEDRDWEEATAKERHRQLLAWREESPDAARIWLEKHFKALSGTEKALLLSALAQNLQAQDLNFLVQIAPLEALNEGSQVLLVALKLRAALDSELRTELDNLLLQWLTCEKKRLKIDRKISPDTPKWDFLQKISDADLLYFLGACCSLKAWYKLCKSVDFEDFKTNIGVQKESNEVWRGIFDGVVLRKESSHVLQVLVLYSQLSHHKKIALASIFDLLTEADWLLWLKRITVSYELSSQEATHPVAALLKNSSRQFKGAEAVCLLNFFEHIVVARRYLVYEWSDQLATLALRLSPSCLAEVEVKWYHLSVEYPHWQTAINNMLKILKLRAVFNAP